MSRQSTHRRRLPAITRRQLRNRTRDLEGRLQDATQDAQRQQREDAALLAGAEECITGQQIRIDELEARVKQQGANGVGAGVLQQRLDASLKANRKLAAEYTAVKNELKSLTTIDGLDQATEPIYAGTLQAWAAERERRQATPEVKPLAEALGGGL